MSKKLIIDWNEYNRSIDELAVQISDSGFKPSFIICIARGGLRVGDILSRIFKVKCGYLGVESYSSAGEGKVSDVQNELTFARDLSTTSKVYGENVLVTDDLIDTGVTLEKTLSWLKNYKDFANGAERVGYQYYATGPYGTNAEPYDGRPGSIQDGFNFQGDKNSSKWSTAVSEIPKALKTGLLDLRPQSHVVQITHDSSGLVDAVIYVDANGDVQRQAAKVVCVAGNSIESPRLLLNSASDMFPNGLANSSDQVGRNYMRHMTGSVYARFEKEVNFYRGETMAGFIGDEVINDPSRGFVGGYYMETLALGPAFLSSFLDPGAWGADFAKMMDGYSNIAGMWLVGEDMPQSTNRVTLSDSIKDQYGMPAPNVHFDDHANDIAMREYAYGKAEALYSSVGAVQIFRTPPYPSTHNLGTNRMSAKPEDGVVNKWGQTHDIKNLFVSDGSIMTTGAAANPTLTITALAIRQGEYLAGELKKGNL